MTRILRSTPHSQPSVSYVAKHSSERTQSEFESRSPGDCRTRCQRGCSFVNAEASIARRSLLEFPRSARLAPPRLDYRFGRGRLLGGCKHARPGAVARVSQRSSRWRGSGRYRSSSIWQVCFTVIRTTASPGESRCAVGPRTRCPAQPALLAASRILARLGHCLRGPRGAYPFVCELDARAALTPDLRGRSRS